MGRREFPKSTIRLFPAESVGCIQVMSGGDGNVAGQATKDAIGVVLTGAPCTPLTTKPHENPDTQDFDTDALHAGKFVNEN
jgi:hypothetical protein